MGETVKVVGVDPGISGAVIVTDGKKLLEAYPMPLVHEGKEKRIDFDGLCLLFSALRRKHGLVNLYLERAIPMAQGAKSAFNYGRGFEALTLAIQIHRFPVTYVEPQKWSKEMHEGISSDLKPKAKSLIAVKRLFPSLVGVLPRKPKGGHHDGFIDALLIAGYGLRKGRNPVPDPNDVGHFY